MSSNGWLKLHRRIHDSEMWSEQRVFSKAEAWIDLLLMARWQKAPHNVVVGMHTFTLNRGEILNTTRELGVRWGWSKAKVHRFLRWLEKRNSIRHDNETVISRVTIVNYEDYQDDSADDKTHVKRKCNAHETHVKRYLKEEEGEEGEERKPSSTNSSKTPGEKASKAELPEVLDTPEFRDAWADWYEYRAESNLKAYVPTGARGQLTKLAKLGHDEAIAAIEHSIAQAYQGIYPSRGDPPSAGQHNAATDAIDPADSKNPTHEEVETARRAESRMKIGGAA